MYIIYILCFCRKSSAYMFIMKTIEIDVYDEKISQTGLLRAEACEWISKLIIVMLTLCRQNAL